MSLLLDEADEVRIVVVHHCSLSLDDGSFVDCFELVAGLKVFADIFRRLFLLFLEISKVGSLLEDVREFVVRVENNVEKSNGTTCIVGQLLHVEQLLAVVLSLKSLLLFIEEFFLWLGCLVEEDDALHWFGDHILCPIFGTQHVVNGVLGGVEA